MEIVTPHLGRVFCIVISPSACQCRLLIIDKMIIEREMKELVLTGNKSGWPDKEENAVFLGEWCLSDNFDYSHLIEKETVNNIIPPVWTQLEKISSGQSYLNNLFLRLTEGVTPCLNAYYGVNFSKKFWAIASYGFLLNWLETLYDRYCYLKKAHDYLEQDERFLVQVPMSLPDFRLRDRNHWSGLVGDHDYNFYLFATLIKYGDFAKFVIKERDISFDFIENEDGVTFVEQLIGVGNAKKDLKGIFKRLLLRFNFVLACSDFHYGSFYGSAMEKYFNYAVHSFIPERLQLPQSRRLWKAVPPNMGLEELAEMDLVFSPLNEFEKIVSQLLLKSIPLYLLSGIPASEPWMRVKYWIGNDVYYGSEAFKVARVVENGGKWISVQHGGGYGTQPVTSETGEFYLSNKFVTWGWKHDYQGGNCFYDLPFAKPRQYDKTGFKKILFITTTRFPYHFKIHSNLMIREPKKYLKMQVDFIKALGKGKLINELIFKPRPPGLGVHVFQKMNELLNDDQIVTDTPANKLMFSSKLVVIDHFTTSILEALAFNIPTVAFWNKDDFPIVDEVLPDIMDLEKVNIYHTDSVKAAFFIDQVYDDVSSWWESEEVQLVRKTFCHKYARTSNIYLKEWGQFLKKLDEC